MNKYKIEIWRYHSIIKTYENEDIKKVLNWYKSNYQGIYDNGGCTFYLYKNGKEIDFEDTYKFGFYD